MRFSWLSGLAVIGLIRGGTALPADSVLKGADAVAPAAKAATTPAMTTALPSKLRGVNIGNWLVLEKWMDSTNLFSGPFANAIDQWTFDSTPGAKAALQQHWSTWFTEADVEIIKSWGLNAVRIPIGYWAYATSVKAPYIKGADAYLEKAVGWCQKHGLKVLIDLHGAPGSQNGYDNSGHAGAVEWQINNNLYHTTQALTQIAKKYATPAYANVVFGIELVNEPISWGNNSFSTTQTWSQNAFKAVQAASKNPSLNIIAHDSFQGPQSWVSIGQTLNGNSAISHSRFWVDTHLYQLFVASDNTLNQDGHIKEACNWANTELLPSSSNMPVIVGEFSAATNICAYPNYTTIAGSYCSVAGCQCSSNTPLQNWGTPLKVATRKFWEAQIQTFENHGKGWFVWAYKAPGAWSLTGLIENKVIGNPVNQIKYTHICKS